MGTELYAIKNGNSFVGVAKDAKGYFLTGLARHGVFVSKNKQAVIDVINGLGDGTLFYPESVYYPSELRVVELTSKEIEQ